MNREDIIDCINKLPEQDIINVRCRIRQGTSVIFDPTRGFRVITINDVIHGMWFLVWNYNPEL